MVKHGAKPGFTPSDEVLCLAAVIVEHCASIADSLEQQELPMIKRVITGAQIRKEWGLR